MIAAAEPVAAAEATAEAAATAIVVGKFNRAVPKAHQRGQQQLQMRLDSSNKMS